MAECSVVEFFNEVIVILNAIFLLVPAIESAFFETQVIF